MLQIQSIIDWQTSAPEIPHSERLNTVDGLDVSGLTKTNFWEISKLAE